MLPNVLMMSTELKNIAILDICEHDYRCIINGISKSKDINSIKNAALRNDVCNYLKLT